jgi:hypothetical protein
VRTGGDFKKLLIVRNSVQKTVTMYSQFLGKNIAPLFYIKKKRCLFEHWEAENQDVCDEPSLSSLGRVKGGGVLRPLFR